MNKKSLSESDICDRFITPSIVQSGWEAHQWRREYAFTDGRIIVRGKMVARGKQKRADYLLFYKTNLPIAVIEAKDNNHSLGAGMQQGLAYSVALDVPFVFSSNGDGFLFHDKTGMSNPVEKEISLNEFPSPDELWSRYMAWKQLAPESEALITSPNHQEISGKEARYYQQLAINRTIEAVAKGQRRALLVMATGTGKTFTAFNIIWRLWKSGKAKRILFLADRNILVDQTMVNDFKPFGQVMTKLDRSLVDKYNGKVDTSYEIYLALYQAIMGGEDREAIYDKFPPDFFDLIVIDECHRGSAADDSAWRTVLDYFSGAIQIGMTATPKETAYVSNIDYFGKPVYSYSLKQGIDDGFLAPFKVIRVDLDWDLQGWRPELDMRDDDGNLIDDRIYNQKDFDKAIVFPERTKEVAHRISSFLHESNPMDKTIVFCTNIDHAERMRQALVNDPLNAELVQQDVRYVMRITGDICIARGDPDAKPFHREGSAPGNYFVSVITRTEHPQERFILDSQYKPDGVSDGTVFTNMALGLLNRFDRMQGVVYDMALKSEDQDRIGATGRHVLCKVTRTKSGRVRSEVIGNHKFVGSGSHFNQDVHSVDGCPVIEVVDIDGEKHLVPLTRKQSKLNGTRMYNHFEVPPHPLVPLSKRGATAWIRVFSSQDDLDAGKPRPRFIRSIPLNDPDFDRLYGLREDTESMHNDYKSRQVNRRARTIGLERRELDLRGYQLHQMAVALAAWSMRTGGDVSEFLGNWKPPERLQRQKAA
jgi:hypothetical protein